MRPAILTEIKYLLPWGVLTVVVAGLVAAATPANGISDYSLMCLGLGCAILAARAFGKERLRVETATESPENVRTIRMSAVSITTLAAAAAFSLMSAKARVPHGLSVPLLAVLSSTPALGIVPYLTVRTRKPFAAVVFSAFIVGAIKIASCVVVRIVYGPEALADGYMAGDWQTAKLMISLFWSGTVFVSFVLAFACARQFVPTPVPTET
ncbi:MAG TPA: hypothetical protein VN887_01330 [Candidatus Angelobacter sp.]|nr:hypothetical protein [Candidatus Angelobacter sp.]